MFSIMFLCRSTWYSVNLPARMFRVQRNAGCVIENYSSGGSRKIMERHKCWSCTGCTYLQSYRALWTVRIRLPSLVGEEANAVTVLGANFSAGFVAGCLAAAATCPLDVAKTRRQIEVCT
ncbi:putative mitochondrial carrier domain superfamily [Helianthus anomalus]